VKIGLVSPYTFSVYGGVQGQVAGLAMALKRRGHSVLAVSPAAWGPVAVELAHAGVEVVDAGRLVRIAVNGSVAPVSLDPAVALRTRAALRRAEVEVVHLHEPLAPVAGYAVLLRPPAPLVATFHRAGGGKSFELLRPLRRFLAHQVASTFAVSHAAEVLARKATAAPVEVLFNGVDTAAPNEVAPRPSTTPTIFFVGRHETRKGLEVLLEAHAGLDGVTLLIAGEGPLTPTLKARYPEGPQRRWLGVVSDEERVAHEVRADVCCAPSLSGESFGVVVLEFLAARTVAVVSDLDGYTEAAQGHARLIGQRYHVMGMHILQQKTNQPGAVMFRPEQANVIQGGKPLVSVVGQILIMAPDLFTTNRIQIIHGRVQTDRTGNIRRPSLKALRCLLELGLVVADT